MGYRLLFRYFGLRYDGLDTVFQSIDFPVVCTVPGHREAVEKPFPLATVTIPPAKGDSDEHFVPPLLEGHHGWWAEEVPFLSQGCFFDPALAPASPWKALIIVVASLR